MYSMNAIGKFISNFRDFYNEINAATLTGAIDVIVVEQRDGSFTCSPFHVRFGKLGVLRSREKVVDIEINGEPADIHMKLGDSGEAFFVEEVTPNELGKDGYIPPHLATSPIPEDHITLPLDRQGSDDQESKVPEENLHESLEVKKELQDEQVVPNSENLPVVDGSNDSQESVGSESAPHQTLPKKFRAETVDDVNLNEKVRKISIANGEFRPIAFETDVDVPGSDACLQPEDGSTIEGNEDENDDNSVMQKEAFKELSEGMKRTSSSAKRKKRRKSLMKRKAGQKKANGSSSQGEQSEQSESSKESLKETSMFENFGEKEAVSQQGLVDMTEKTDEVPEDTTISGPFRETSTTSLDSINLLELSRIQNASAETDFHFFSDTELTPGCSRISDGRRYPTALVETAFEVIASAHFPVDSRPCSPVQSDTEFEIKRHSKAGAAMIENGKGGQVQQSWKWGELPSPPPRSLGASQKSLALKETKEIEPISSSDEEVSKQKTEAAAAAEAAAQRSMLSGMFSFMKKTKRIRHNPESEGIYLSDLNAEGMDPEVAALYFPTSYRQGQEASLQHGQESAGRLKDEDAESGNGTSLPQSPHSVEGAIGGPKSVDSDFEEPKHTIFEMKSYGEISLSLCGGLSEELGPSEDNFLQSLVTFEDVVQDPKVVESPNLVVRLNGKYYNWRTACPLVMSLVAFQKPLPQQVVDALYNEYMPVKKEQKKDQKQSSYSSWFYWRRTSSVSEPKKVSSGHGEPSTPESEKNIEIKEFAELEVHKETVISDNQEETSPKSAGNVDAVIENCKEFDKQSDRAESEEKDENAENALQDYLSEPSEDLKESKEEGYSGSNSSDDSDTGHPKTQGVKLPMEKRSYYDNMDKYRKTLRLSSGQIARLKLKEGANEVVFSVTTAYQGTTRCKCHIYKWRFDDKIVISDIDGTITKSDVLGHILPIVGKDWAQSGVAQLFTKIKNNGYRLLYLSARAIGQARVTRDYLKSIKQGDLSLPDGPLLLNPTSLLSAFHREVIEKKPEEFKISCLRDIQALFPTDTKPFYAGYGNRINDVWAYRAVGIPIFRIFTINHRGELKHELTQTFQSSYSNMSYIVDQMFPPPPEDTSEDFTNFVYWREPIPDIDADVVVLTEGHGLAGGVVTGSPIS